MADDERDALEELDRQVGRASLFSHASMGRIAARATGIEARLEELIGLLREKGVVAGDELPGQAAGPPRPDPSEPGGIPWPAIALRQPLPVARPAAEVNCAERMHVCHAVCCKLNFALTAGEVEAGAVRFDLGFPYMIRHDAHGTCVHNDRETGFCGVYEDRPGICRTYSCVNDGRIWRDFDAMELNTEWLDEHLGDPSRLPLQLRPAMEESP